MAIPIFDAASNSNGGNVASITWSHTCTGVNLVLYVGVHEAYGVDNVSGVTYNGVAMTRVKDSFVATGCYVYRLIAPATGAHDIVVTFSSTLDRGKAVGAVSVTGANQTTPEHTSTEGSDGATDTAYAQNITTTVVDTLLLDIAAWRPGSSSVATIAADGGQTERVNISPAHAADTAALGMSTKAAATDDTYSMGWTSNINCQKDVCIISIAGVSAGTTNHTSLSLLGIG